MRHKSFSKSLQVGFCVAKRVQLELRKGRMTTKLVVGLDGHATGEKALEYGKRMAKLIGDCEIVIAYVIEWSPFSFQTPEENAERHKRREEEIILAMERVVAPAEALLKKEGVAGHGVVRHGSVPDVLDQIAQEEKAELIIVCRSSDGGFVSRIFGGSTAALVMNASVPVTVIN